MSILKLFRMLTVQGGELVIRQDYYTSEYLIARGITPLFGDQNYLLDSRQPS